MAETLYQLVVQKGPKPGQVYLLQSTSVTVGRDPMADIVISDPEVSRQHARLRRTESGYRLQDLGSTNGTFVDGERLGAEAVELAPGQLVGMGSGIVLLYRREGDEEDEEYLAGQATMMHARRPGPGRAAEPEPFEFEGQDFEREEEWPRRHEPDVRYRPAEQPPVRRPAPLPPPAAVDGDTRRRNTIIAAVILLVLCCCCAFPLSGWYIWGDPLLDLLRSLGFF